jgi:hypothetical protein
LYDQELHWYICHFLFQLIQLLFSNYVVSK